MPAIDTHAAALIPISVVDAVVLPMLPLLHVLLEGQTAAAQPLVAAAVVQLMLRERA